MRVTLADDRSDPQLHPVAADDLVKLASEALLAEGFPANAVVEVTLIDADRMAQLNEAHMGKSGATDVLSFPLESLTPGLPPDSDPDGPPFHIGDIFICPEVVAVNAGGSGLAFDAEMGLMVVHGVLHLLGYDHVIDAEAEQMEQRERELMATMGLVRP